MANGKVILRNAVNTTEPLFGLSPSVLRHELVLMDSRFLPNLPLLIAAVIPPTLDSSPEWTFAEIMIIPN